MKIALIGGGKASLVLLDHFCTLDGYDPVFVCDIDENAPGLIQAREKGILTCTDLTAIAEHPEIKLVFEITGSEKVYDLLIDSVLPEQVVISADTARLIFDLIDHHDRMAETIRNRALTEEYSALLETFQASLKPIDNSRRELDDMFRKMKFININAKIESVKVGSEANAFSAVIDEMANVMKQTDQTLTFLDEAIRNVNDSIEEIKNARSKLLDENGDTADSTDSSR